MSKSQILFEKNFAINHADWKPVEDTVELDTIIGFKDIKVLVTYT